MAIAAARQQAGPDRAFYPFVDFSFLVFGDKRRCQGPNFRDVARAVAQFGDKSGDRIEFVQPVARGIVGDIAIFNRRISRTFGLSLRIVHGAYHNKQAARAYCRATACSNNCKNLELCAPGGYTCRRRRRHPYLCLFLYPCRLLCLCRRQHRPVTGVLEQPQQTSSSERATANRVRTNRCKVLKNPRRLWSTAFIRIFYFLKSHKRLPLLRRGVCQRPRNPPPAPDMNFS